MASLTKAIIALVSLLTLLTSMAGCGAPSGVGTMAGAKVETFLSEYALQTKGGPVRFRTKVPESWAVPMGAYPEGLYWGLANELSKDVGLDLTPLKGQTVTVWRYALRDGLPGRQPHNSEFRYPVDVIILVRDDGIVGAWLMYDRQTIGPSVKMRYLDEITGLTFEQWVEREKYFTDLGKNADLVSLGPIEVLNAFFDAINHGDKARATACLSPRAMLSSLTMNLSGESRLYNPGFSRWNSQVESIRQARMLSYKMTDPANPGVAITEVGDRTRVAVALYLEISHRDRAFDSPNGRTPRFTALEKYPNGWKLTGLGTAP